MKNLILIICFIGMGTQCFAQTETTTSPETKKTISPFYEKDITLTGNINYLKNNNGGALQTSSGGAESTLNVQIQAQRFMGENFSLGIILGYENAKYSASSFDLYYTPEYNAQMFYYGITARRYFPIFPRAYAFIGLEAYTGEIVTKVESRFHYPLPNGNKVSTRYVQSTINPGISFFITNALILELEYGQLGIAASFNNNSDVTTAFANLNTLSMGLSFRF